MVENNTPLAGTWSKDEMSQNAAFHQGLHCLLRQKHLFGTEIRKYMEIISCDPSIDIMDRPELIVSNLWKIPFI